MEKLHLDFEYLVFAWEDDGLDTAYYLDTETGSIVLVQKDLEDIDEIKDEIESQPSRFLYVPKPAHEHLILDLSDFIYTVTDSALQEQLQTAYDRSNKFQTCSNILAKHPEEMTRWQRWRHDAARKRAHRWLAAHNIEAAGS